MGPQTYFFYDLETTGLNRSFDQVLQFAAIRTDENFKELARHEIIIKLRPDVVPSPEAMLAHGFPLEQCRAGVCEYEAMREIHSLLNQPGTISLGYNSLGFDDEFLRFAFHRNLLPPYTHQYANQCGRMDLLPIVATYWLYKHEVLQWPQIEGKSSLRLEHLKEANNLAEGKSHNAVTDVEASVELARRLAHEQDMWRYLRDYFDKGIDELRSQKLKPLSASLPEKYKLGLFIRVNFGSENGFQAPVLFLGNSNCYRNQTIWLRLDQEDLRETTPQNISGTTWVQRKKFGEPGIILPAYERFMSKMDSQRVELLAENKRWLESHASLLQTISDYHCEFSYPEVPNVDVDAVLYQLDFLSEKEQALCQEFHALPPAEKPTLLGKLRRPEIHELAKRVLFRNFPDQVPFDLTGDLQTFTEKVNPANSDLAFLDYRGKRKLTPAQALATIGELRAKGELDEAQEQILLDLQEHLLSNFKVESPAGSQD